jgi:6-pyruvoyltetrahydropterin/6-carboxytetrahydropterin synthase
VYRIEKTFEFSAAHYLEGLPASHPCSRMHGHNYVVKVVLEKPQVDKVGFVRDYRELDKLKQWLNNCFDHRLLNKALNPRDNPTAENMARIIYTYAVSLYPEVSAVGVSETPKTWAYYSPQSLTLDVISRAVEGLPEPLRTDFEAALRGES